MSFLFCWVLFFSFLSLSPSIAGEPLSKHFTVMVEGQNIPVYTAKTMAIASVSPEVRQEGEAAFASFDINGNVKVDISFPGPVQDAKVLPSSSGVRPVISGNQVFFVVTKPENLTLEINGDWMNSLHLFANPIEKNIPNPHDPNVIYFGPGVHRITPMKVSSGKTVYVSAGAVIYGKFGIVNRGPLFSLEGSHISVRGRGIIDGSLIPNASPNGNILKVHGQDIEIEGVILRDSSMWTLPIISSSHVNVRGVKIFGWRDNSDGIDIVSSSDVHVSDSFIRTFDDLIVVKAIKSQGGESKGITIERDVLWNEIAHALSLGAELQKNISDVVFSDCDIIHDKGREWLLRIFNTDSGMVSHVLFENIRVEESRRLISLWIGEDMWSRDHERGHIEDVVFRNIQSVTPESDDRWVELVGFDEDHAIHEVTFDNVTKGDLRLMASDIDINDYVKEIKIEPSSI